jgi:hypothetical protein
MIMGARVAWLVAGGEGSVWRSALSVELVVVESWKYCIIS